MKYFIEVEGETFEYPSQHGLIEFIENSFAEDSSFPDRVDRVWRQYSDNSETELGISWSASLEDL